MVIYIEVATAIMSINRQFGPMKVLHTDNGKEFKKTILCKITEFTRIRHRFGSSYHPRAKGAVERENADIEQLLKKMCMAYAETELLGQTGYRTKSQHCPTHLPG
jgi:IS30 family transposase